jgi:uncharacterized protein YggU (UPF0235/DUF167 family)
VRFLADILGLPPSSVRLVKGASSRYKTVEIDGLTQQEIDHLLEGPVP